MNMRTIKFKKIAAFLLVFVVVCGVFLTGCTGNSTNNESESGKENGTTQENASEPKVSKASFSAVGDNLIHEPIYREAYERGGGKSYDFSYCYAHVTSFLQKFDINVMNQETLVSDEIQPSTYPTFCSPGDLTRSANKAGWNVYTIGNNHTYDKGAEGIASTLRFWDSMKDEATVSGLYKNTQDDSGIELKEVNGITFAYLSFTGSTNGIPTPENAAARVIMTDELALMERLTTRAKELADVVVVAMHWGAEYTHEQNQTQETLAKQISSWGADVIVGTHPHVIQPVEWIENDDGRKTIVAYSLGNFLSAQANGQRMIGLAMTMDFEQTIGSDGVKKPVSIQNVKVYPVVTHYDYGFKNMQTYMFSDYTAELAAKHGCQAADGQGTFTLDYIRKTVKEVVASEFLAGMQ